MRDLKSGTQQKTKKIRHNRRKQEKKPLNLQKLLRRTLRIGVTLSSAALLISGSFFLVQLLMASDLFRVEEISVQGFERLSEDKVIALSDIQAGVNTFHLDLDLIGNKIEENPWVRTARVQRIFPRQVVITLRERRPVAIINLGYLYYLDDQGEIFKVLDAEDRLDFPVVTGFDYEKAQGHDGDYARKLKQIVSLITNLENRRLVNLQQVSEIHHDSDGGLSLFTLRGAVQVKLGQGDFMRKLNRLERIYGQLQPKLQILDYIDLNVDEKVIVRIERPKEAAKS